MNPLHRERLVQIKRGGVPAEFAEHADGEPNEEAPPESIVRPTGKTRPPEAVHPEPPGAPAMGPLDEGSPPPPRTGTDA
ncbi:MAG TPA: hypothetical protein VLS89_05925 [Candidatus Nanopelagicales bacterium]|nr:hypothetical protein [Candidatus Nanopelagicales bacterium]